MLLRLLVATELSVANDLQSGNVHLHGLQHLVGLGIHKDLLLLKGRVLGDEVKTALSPPPEASGRCHAQDLSGFSS